MTSRRYVKTPWPDGHVPFGEPSWFLYEIDDAADAVTRSICIYADGAVTRNSLEIEKRSGTDCPSLIDSSVARGFEGADLQQISPEAFGEAWGRGVDTPFWSVG